MFLWLAREDHPRACTGRRLVQRGLAKEVHGSEPRLGAALLLDPAAAAPLGPYDAARVRRHGLLGVDCSWNRFTERGGYPSGASWLAHLRFRRRLPWLLATNPQHFGRMSQLTTAEAFGASLWLVGEHAAAEALLDPFPGGLNFFDVNRNRFDVYERTRSPEELLAAEATLGE